MSVGSGSHFLFTATNATWTCLKFAGESKQCRNAAAYYQDKCNPIESLSICDGRHAELHFTWVSQLIGPFNTSGGHDFTVTVYRTWALAGRTIQSYVAAPVDTQLNFVSFPPLYLHHWEVFDMGNVIMAHAGDSECLAQLENVQGRLFGMECLGVNYSPYVQKIHGAVYLDPTLNDVRPTNSPMLTWWVLSAWKVVSRRHQRYISTFEVSQYAPAIEFGSYLVPMLNESRYWFAGRFPLSGKLVFFRYHQHIYQDAVMLDGLPSFFGLSEANERPCEARAMHVNITSDFACDVELRSIPESLQCRRVICWAKHTLEHDHQTGAVHPRKSITRCRQDYIMVAGSPFTAITYSRPSIPGTLQMERQSMPATYHPGFRLSHSFFTLFFLADDESSHALSTELSSTWDELPPQRIPAQSFFGGGCKRGESHGWHDGMSSRDSFHIALSLLALSLLQCRFAVLAVSLMIAAIIIWRRESVCLLLCVAFMVSESIVVATAWKQMHNTFACAKSADAYFIKHLCRQQDLLWVLSCLFLGAPQFMLLLQVMHTKSVHYLLH